jgi:histidinol-phosphate aminotransferase
MISPNPVQLVRRLVRRLEPYLPGEQPVIKGLVKLNTNENPYPPSPKVRKAVSAAVDDRLRLYPNATCEILRERLAGLHGCRPDNIIVGNGSDELLAMAVRTFVDPLLGRFRRVFRSTVQYFTPSYSLYPVLAEIHGAARNPVRLNPDFSIPAFRELRRSQLWDFRAGLSFITTPNAPGGCAYSTSELEQLCIAQKGVVVLDEAYVDFASENALGLALKYPHVLVARTFSKAYSLCFQRVGYFVGHPELIAALNKIRDSYNVNGLGQVAALATLDDLPYYRANFKAIVQSRDEVGQELNQIGFRVLPSQTNFILARPPKFPAEEWQRKLRERKLLVRWFSHPDIREYLRITIGTPEEMRAFLNVVRDIIG